MDAPPRRRKSAAERRAQRARADSRALQRVLTGLRDVHEHRGCQLSRAGRVFHDILNAQNAQTLRSEPLNVYGGFVGTWEPLLPAPQVARDDPPLEQPSDHQAHCYQEAQGVHPLSGTWSPVDELEDAVLRHLVLKKYEFCRTRSFDAAVQTHISGDIATRAFCESLAEGYQSTILQQLAPMQEEVAALSARVAVL